MSITIDPPELLFPTKVLSSFDTDFDSYKEDMIEWMNYDDSTSNEMYIFNLNNMIDHNRSILHETSVEGLDLQTEYDY